jgi:hypothetical protein
VQNETKTRSIVSGYSEGTVGELGIDQLDNGNWIFVRIPYALGGLTILLLALSFVFPLAIIGAIASGSVCVCYLRAIPDLPRGGDLQVHICKLVLRHLEWDEKGRPSTSGAEIPPSLLAWLNAPLARVTGIDYWGGK